MQKKIDRLKENMSNMEELVENFQKNKREDVLFDRWSLHDVVIHINAWNQQRIEHIKHLLNNQEIERIDDYDKFNADAIASKESVDTPQIIEELRERNSELVNAYRSIPDNLLDYKFWPGINATPSMWVGIDLDHIKDHIKEIEDVMENGYQNLTEGKETASFQLEPPPHKDLQNGFDELRHLLMLEDIFENFEDITGLIPDPIIYRVMHSEEADWDGEDLVCLNYSRGFWAYLSMIHELVHIVLRQYNWDEDPVLDQFFIEHPEVNLPSRGRGYKVEQMIAYLVQKDCAKILDKKFGGDNYLKEWNEEKFELILEREYGSEELMKMGRMIMRMWDESQEDVISFSRSIAIKFRNP